MLTRREFVIGGAIAASSLLFAGVEATHTGSNGDVAISHVGAHWPSSIEWALLSSVNAYRKSYGRRPLLMSRSLAAAARHHAYYMARTDDVDHTLGSVSWSQNILNYTYPSAYLGETAAAGRQSANATVYDWAHSPAHNAILLDPKFIRMGAGRVYNGEGVYRFYWIATFGSVSSRTIYQ